MPNEEIPTKFQVVKKITEDELEAYPKALEEVRNTAKRELGVTVTDFLFDVKKPFVVSFEKREIHEFDNDHPVIYIIITATLTEPKD